MLTGVHEHVFDVVLFGSEGFTAESAGVGFLLALLRNACGRLLLRPRRWRDAAEATGKWRQAVGRHGHELGLLGAHGLGQAEEERLVLTGRLCSEECGQIGVAGGAHDLHIRSLRCVQNEEPNSCG